MRRTIAVTSENPLSVNLVTGGIDIAEGGGPVNFHFEGTVTTESRLESIQLYASLPRANWRRTSLKLREIGRSEADRFK
jgi:hypothetical protein